MRVMVREVVLSALVPPSHLTATSTGAWQPCHACLAPQWSRRYPARLQQNHSDTFWMLLSLRGGGAGVYVASNRVRNVKKPDHPAACISVKNGNVFDRCSALNQGSYCW